MRSLALFLLLALAGPGATLRAMVTAAAPAPQPVGRNPTPQERFSADCRRMTERDIPALEHRYRLTIRRGTAHIARATWEKMDRFERAGLHWPLAYSASCALGRPSTHKVRILDERGRQLAFQMISTQSECHGDHAIIRPEDVEYPC